jgi:hypothetical protein
VPDGISNKDPNTSLALASPVNPVFSIQLWTLVAAIFGVRGLVTAFF